MISERISNKRLLRRRDSSFATLQSMLDGIMIIGSVYLAAVIIDGEFTFQHLLYLIVLLVFLAIYLDRMGLYRRLLSRTRKGLLLFRAWSITFAFIAVTGLVTETTDWISLQMLVVNYLGGMTGQFLLHYFVHQVNVRFLGRREVVHSLILGSGQLAYYLADKINANPWLQERVIGLVCARENESGKSEREGLPFLGFVSDVPELVRQHQVRTIYIADGLESSPLISKMYEALLDKNVDIHWAPDIFSLNLVNHSVKEIAGVPLITLSETPLIGNSLLVKNLLDRVFASLILISVSPIMLVTALAVKLTSEGPVFFRQKRTGWNGDIFEIVKFRSMQINQEKAGKITQATRDDSRITPVGRLIRRTSIDELPQLFNVLNGTMSLVGPRPHAISHDNDYSQRIKHYFARMRIKPGITGLAQVRGFRGETAQLEEMRNRVESDLEYINTWTIGLDLIILFRTVLAFGGKKAY